jgi:serine protease AprX
VGSDLFRGSGTSQAAAVVSGLAALLLQQRPALTPDQVKAALTSTARVLPSAPATAQGSGLVNALAALQIAPSTTVQSWERSSGNGSLESARGSLHAVFNGQTISGEMDAWGRSFDSRGWAEASASGSSWSGSSWSASSWSGSSWSGSSWSGSSWSGSSWSGSTWSGSSWSATEWG